MALRRAAELVRADERTPWLTEASSIHSAALMPFASAAGTFEVVEADERTLQRMEADCSNHPLSDAAAVTAWLQAALAALPAVNQLRTQLQLLDIEGTGRVGISKLQVSMPGCRCMGSELGPVPSVAAHVAAWSGWGGLCSQRGVLIPHIDM